MSEFSSKIVIDPIMQQFLDNIKAQDRSPIYELSPYDARNILLKVQDIPVEKQPAYIEEIVLYTGPKGKVKIKIIRPQNSKAKLPPVMYFHGGGWILGDANTHDRLIREIAYGAEVAVIFVDFSKSPEDKYPVALEEAYHTTQYISENADSLNLDASKLVVMGDSVGGNMATVVAILAKDRGGPKIDYQILLYPVTNADFETESYNKFAEGYWLSKEAMKWFWNAYLPEEEKRQSHMVSPLLAPIEILKDLPPALIIINEYDVLRDEGEAYAHKLMEAGVNTVGIRLMGTIHDCLLLNPLAQSPVVKNAIKIVNCKLHEVFYS